MRTVHAMNRQWVTVIQAGIGSALSGAASPSASGAAGTRDASRANSLRKTTK